MLKNLQMFIHQGGESLTPNLFCSRMTTPNIQLKSLKTIFSIKTNWESWKWWYGPSRTLIHHGVCLGLHWMKFCGWFAKMFGTNSPPLKIVKIGAVFKAKSDQLDENKRLTLPYLKASFVYSIFCTCLKRLHSILFSHFLNSHTRFLLDCLRKLVITE